MISYNAWWEHLTRDQRPFLHSESLQIRGLHGGPGTRPGTRMGSVLYFKWSAGPGSGPNLLLQVPGLFNFVCNTEQSQAQHPPTSTHYYKLTSPPEAWDLLMSDASWYHHREAQNHSPEHSLSPFLAGGMIFPSPSGMLDPCQFSSNNWKLISFNSTWLYKKKKKKKKKKKTFHFFKIFLFIFLSFPC